MRNKSLAYGIVDAHAHMGYTSDAYRILPEEILNYMDRLGIEKSFISGFEALAGDPEKGNNLMIKLSNENPERFYVYLCINPHFLHNVEEYLDNNLKKKNVVGIKLHPTVHKYHPKGPNYLRIYEYANKNKVLVLNHNFGDYKQIEEIAITYPNMKMIVGHGASGTDKDQIKYLAKNLKGREDLYFDTTSSSLCLGGIEYYLELMGSRKVIFGTDIPFLDPAYQLGRILYSRISDKDKYLILRENSESILEK